MLTVGLHPSALLRNDTLKKYGHPDREAALVYAILHHVYAEFEIKASLRRETGN